MKISKKILLILSLLIITGCDLQYNLTITNKNEVKENFKVFVTNQSILESGKSVDEYLNYYSNLYITNDGYKEYKIKTKKLDSKSYFNVSRNYKTLDDYFNSNSFKSIFNSANVESIGDYITVNTSNNTYFELYKNDPDQVRKFDDFKISIKFYNEVIDSNADEVNKSNNVYTWHVTENDTDSTIYFKIGPNVKYLVIIKDWFIVNLSSIIAVASFLLLLASILVFIYIKAKKNNEV